MRRISRNWRLVTDFDKTLTRSDTTNFLIQKSKKKHIWSKYAKLYYEQLAIQEAEMLNNMMSFIHKKHVDAKHRKNDKLLINVLDAFKDLDDFHSMKVNEYRGNQLFDRFSVDVIKEASSQIEFRPYAIETLNIAETMGYMPHVLSVNWCLDMLCDALEAVDWGLPPSRVHANQFFQQEQEYTETEKMLPPCDNSRDKLQKLSSFFPENTSLIYVGDATMDLPCLLLAKIPIIMGKDATLMKVLHILGIQISHVNILNKDTQKILPFLEDRNCSLDNTYTDGIANKGTEGVATVYWTENWNDIYTLLHLLNDITCLSES